MGAAAVPAVVAASKATKANLVMRNDCPNTIKSLMDYKPTHAYSTRPLYSNGKAIPLDEHGNAYAPIMYDQSGSGLIRTREVWFDSDWGQVKMKPTK